MGLNFQDHTALSSSNSYVWISQPRRFSGRDLLGTDSSIRHQRKHHTVPEAPANKELLNILHKATLQKTTKLLTQSMLALQDIERFNSSHSH